MDVLDRYRELNVNQVAALFNVHRATIYRWRTEGRMPPAIRHSEKCIRWRLMDLIAFQDDLKAGHDPCDAL